MNLPQSFSTRVSNIHAKISQPTSRTPGEWLHNSVFGPQVAVSSPLLVESSLHFKARLDSIINISPLRLD